jgi:outer membrane receptor protein involved in Fe transport
MKLRAAEEATSSQAPREHGCLSGRNKRMKNKSCAANAAAFWSPAMFACSGAILLGAALLCGPATAGPDPAAAGPANPATEAPARGELEEIVVTAEKRDSTVQATPISMTALSSNDLAEQNIV